jgi:GH15 family glucan-1,4-alpha-glucosidase
MACAGEDLAPLRELVRKVECLSGRVDVEWVFEPRFEYGGVEALIDRRAGCLFAAHRREALSLGVWGGDEPVVERGRARGVIRLESGGSGLLTPAADHQEPAVLPPRRGSERRLADTVDLWKRWSDRASYDGPWREAVIRSVLALKLLVFSPSGAIVAAGTTSLPEEIGGSRNWDYRYTWLRDAAYTLNALTALGYEDEARAFFWWLMHASRRSCHPAFRRRAVL